MTHRPIAQFRLTTVLWLTGVTLSGALTVLAAADERPATPAFQPGSDWPMYRRDPALSAESPIVGGLATAPSVAWSIELGGSPVLSESVVVRDVTGDGREEFLTFAADSVVCRDSRGQPLWRLDNFLNPTLIEILDFAGDGSHGIVLTTHRAGVVDMFIVNGRTGKATHLWRDENNFGGHTRIGKLLPDVAGMQIAATSSGQTPPAAQGGDVRLVSFEQGVDRPTFRVREHVTGVFYSPLILVVDLDGDGRDELAVISHEQVWAFDTTSGRQTFYAAYSGSIRTYMATVAAVKLNPDDTCPAFVMINPSLPGLKAVSQDGRTVARELWKVVIGGQEDQYQKRVTVAPGGTSLVYDPDNDGRYILFASIKNEHGDGESRLVVFEARSGRRLAELPDAQILAADDLDGDGKQEFLLSRGNELLISRWQANILETVWQQVGVVPVLRPLSLGGDLHLTSGSSPLAKGNASPWRETAGGADFLLRFPDGVHACRLDRGNLKIGDLVTQHEALGNLPTVARHEQVIWDGAKLVSSIEGREVYRYLPSAPITYLAPPPLVADLGGKRRILVRNAAGEHLICSTDGSNPRVLLKQPGDRAELLVDPMAIGPLVCDIDGDGENEIVATALDADRRPACVILSANGSEKRRIELLPGMTALNVGATGRLGPGPGRWILLRMSGISADNERRFVVTAYDGRSGEQLWVRSHYGRYGDKPVAFLAHFPSAVVDYDNDQADDWLVCSENFYGIIDIKHNQDLVGPVVLSDVLPGHWTAYTFPSIARLGDDLKSSVFHHGAYSLALVTDLEGRPLWHFGMTRDTAGRWGQFIDLDGDGRREVIHVQPDGVIRCFEPTQSTHCPSCPSGPSAGDATKPERWHLDLGRPVSRMVACDIDGDGRMELLFGCDDGKLHALGERDGQPRLVWSVSIGRRVGEPVLVDLDGDGRPAILVPAEDGRLYCMKCGT